MRFRTGTVRIIAPHPTHASPHASPIHPHTCIHAFTVAMPECCGQPEFVTLPGCPGQVGAVSSDVSFACCPYCPSSLSELWRWRASRLHFTKRTAAPLSLVTNPMSRICSLDLVQNLGLAGWSLIGARLELDWA